MIGIGAGLWYLRRRYVRSLVPLFCMLGVLLTVAWVVTYVRSATLLGGERGRRSVTSRDVV